MRVLFLTIALAAVSNYGVNAQQPPQSGYHSVACIKVRDGKAAEFRQFLDESRKLRQAAADLGRMTAGYLFRSIMPAGEAASCDYLLVSVFQGAPPAPLGREEFANFLQKAGISTSPGDFVARRSSLSKLVSMEMWRTVIGIGEIQKGDYVFINHMKVADMPAYMEMEREIWKPMAESWIKDGTLHGWVVARPVVPGGTGLKYQAVTVDVVPNWETAFEPRPVAETFKKVHADKDVKEVMEKFGKARSLDLRELMVVEDKIVAGAIKETAGGH